MRKFIFIVLVALLSTFFGWYAFVFKVPYSEGFRSGELIKISYKGVLFKTWDGEISQGISGAQIFPFSVLDDDQEVIEELKNLQGQYVKLTYIERYRTFYWWGDSKYFVTKVEKDQSPHFNKK
jgi:hypothetical protein